MGASGSGTTTLGSALAEFNSWPLIDADDYYWCKTDPPYQHKRVEDERLTLMLEAQAAHECSIVTGSVINWGVELEDSFDLIVFLYLAVSIRIERLRIREMKELGTVDEEFLQWASEYDSGPLQGRSLAKHETWLSHRTCTILRIEGDLSVEQRTNLVLAEFRKQGTA